MKRFQYVVAVTCLMVATMGFVGLYATNQTDEKDEVARNQQIVEESEKIILNSDLSDIEETEEVTEENQLAEMEDQVELEGYEDFVEETPVGTITEEALHFNPENGVVWPIEGTVLLDYSMDATIFFPTLQQYAYNPAMVLSGAVNDKVYFVAKGKITNIETNEETGCTVTQDIGDGYTAVYGQLKELNFEVGDMVEAGQVVGYVSEPTKYYSVEGSNVYFQVLKNGVPVDPEEILP